MAVSSLLCSLEDSALVQPLLFLCEPEPEISFLSFWSDARYYQLFQHSLSGFKQKLQPAEDLFPRNFFENVTKTEF